MDLNLYQPEDPILDRLESRLKGPLSLREVFSQSDLTGVITGKTPAPAVALVAMPAIIRDPAMDCVLIETRWLVAAIAANVNDRRAAKGRDEAGRIAVAAIQHLIGWQPAADFTPLLLQQIPARHYTDSRVIVPLVFATSTTIDAIE